LQNDVVPSSLRLDAIHFNFEGQQRVARRIKQYIDAHGW
jgi:lysophospholipase L1-like esterase